MNSTGRNAGIRPLPYKNYRMLLWHVLFWACFLFYKLPAMGQIATRSRRADRSKNLERKRSETW
nr:MAG TPA: hypothetical protein [Caudoviricetes sp.]